MRGKPVFQRGAGGLTAILAAAVSGGAAFAAPADWEMKLQEGVSPIAEMIHSFNSMTQVIIVAITLLVLGLLAWVMIRYNTGRNPTPSRTSHNTLVEVLWTVVPVLVLIVIAIPSFRLLYAQYDPSLAIENYDSSKAITIKATGVQWYWQYNYPDHDGLDFESRMLTDAQRTDPDTQPRLLAVNHELVVPEGVVVRLQVTGFDVIHAFAMQPFGIKVDAVPGRLNETWFRADKAGIYYGQCSELCGKDHAFMPIAVRVVPRDKFDAWVAAAKSDLEGAYKALHADLDASKGKAVATR